MLIDTHVHLDDSKYDADREALVERAAQVGVGTLVSIGTDLADSRWVVGYVQGKSGVFGSVGQHPERVDHYDPSQLAEFKTLAQGEHIVAIGEVGLDFHRPEFTLASQEPVFRSMIGLARELGLPLVIHQREAAEDTLRILRDAWKAELGGVFHCFAGTWATARAALDMNFDIAVGGILTFKNASELRDVIRQMPLERLVLETDGPWLAPQKWRGQRNEPAYLTAVAEALAALKSVSVGEIEEATTANARRLFRIGG